MTYSDVQQRENFEAIVFSQVDVIQEQNPIAAFCHAIIKALIIAVFQDIQKQAIQSVNEQEIGWRNKYNIHLMSGVSQKQIYKEYGILDRLIERGSIEKRPSQSRWGKQKHQYRLSFSLMKQGEGSL
ncbi:MAG: hypothetical protein RTU63_10250 [Candidatus Thorarchaeota archaeon]